MRRLALLSVIASTACSLDLAVPANVTVTCESNAECPTGTICDTNVGRCVASETPSLRVDVPNELVTRYTDEVPFQIDIVSADSGAAFDLQVEFRLVDEGEDAWRAMSFTPASAVIDGVRGSPSGTTYQLIWDALADATLANGLGLARVDRDGDGRVSDPIVLPEVVVIRAVARNAAGSVRSIPAESPPFTIGNAAPEVTILQAIGTSGIINVVLGLSDSNADLCGFELQFKGRDDDAWRSAALSYGNTTDLGCRSDTPLNASVGWNSRAPFFTVAEQPLTVPQGIGNASMPSTVFPRRVSLRARAYDRADASRTDANWGLWSPVLVVDRVVNQTPPVVANAQAPRGHIIGGTSVVHIRYALVDEQSDSTNVTVEFSEDAGASWRRCIEYGYSLSEGTQGLLTAPGGVDGAGGVEHLFSWDASHGSPTGGQGTLLRITADDGLSAPTNTVFGLGNPAAPSGEPPHDALAHVAFSRNITASNGNSIWPVEDVAIADFDSDGRRDLLFSNAYESYPAGLTLVRNLGTASWTTSYVGPFASRVVAGDFTSDGVQSFVGVQRNGTAQLYRGFNNLTFAAETAFNVGNNVDDVRVADLDGDGDADLVVLRHDPTAIVTAYRNTGSTGAARFPTASFTRTYTDLASIAVGDLDADGIPDIAVVVGQEGHALGGDGAGGFADIGTFTAINNGADARGITIGDVNGDGVGDLININSFTIGYNVGALAGSGTTYTTREFPLPAGTQYRFIRGGDLNGDGLTDVVFSGSVAPLFGVAFAYNDPVTGEVAPQFGTVTLDDTRLPFPDDLDGDGVAEIVVLTGNGSSSFSKLDIDKVTAIAAQPFQPGTTVTGDPNTGTGVPLVGNFDADGVPDLVYVSSRNGLHRGVGATGTGEAAFGPGERIDGDGKQAGRAPIAADLNGDGALDIVYLMQPGPSGLELGWVLGRTSQGVGDARFTPEQSVVLPGATSAGQGQLIQVADFDRDGLLDVAYLYNADAMTPSPRLGVAFNRGGGFAGEDATYTLAETPNWLQMAYIGNDPLPDLVVSTSSSIRVFDNTVSPVNRASPFTQGGFATAGSPLEVHAADLNWDGVTDLVYRFGTSVIMRNGIAGGGFAAATEYIVNASLSGVAVLDVNFDGYNDLLLNQVFSSSVGAIAPGNTTAGVPTGVFAPGYATFDSTAREAVAIGDFNCDTAPDYVDRGQLDQVVVLVRERDGFVPTLSRGAPPLEARSTSLASLGLPRGVAAHSWHIASGGPCFETPRWEDHLRAFRARAGGSPRFRVLSPAYWLGETVRYKKTRVGDAVRLVAEPRIAPALDLATEGNARGLVGRITVAPGRRGSVVPARLRVYVQREAMLTAAEVAQDPLHSDPNAARMVPQVLTSRGLTDVIRRRWTWQAIPVDADGDLLTGTGKRFVYDPVSGRADILTDEGGLYVVVEEL